MNEKVSRPPENFHWLLPKKLSGSAQPQTLGHLWWMKEAGIRAIIYLKKEEPLDEDIFAREGLDYIFIPVDDYMPPALNDAILIVKAIDRYIDLSKAVNVCCGAGIGRTGTILCMYLICKGFSPRKAILKVASTRNGWAYGTSLQLEGILLFAEHIRGLSDENRVQGGV